METIISAELPRNIQMLVILWFEIMFKNLIQSIVWKIDIFFHLFFSYVRLKVILIYWHSGKILFSVISSIVHWHIILSVVIPTPNRNSSIIYLSILCHSTLVNHIWSNYDWPRLSFKRYGDFINSYICMSVSLWFNFVLLIANWS